MLVLTRKAGEWLLIWPWEELPPETTVRELFADGPIRIGLARIHESQARVVIDAPPGLKILRAELGDRDSSDR